MSVEVRNGTILAPAGDGSYGITREQIDPLLDYQLEWIHQIAKKYHGQRIRLLDAGCGQGRGTISFVRELYAHGIKCDVHLIDSHSQMTAKAAELTEDAAAFEAGWIVRQQDILELDLPEHSVDAILFSSVLGWIPRAEDALRKLHRVLTPNGELYLTTMSIYNGVMLAYDSESTSVGKKLERATEFRRVNSPVVVQNLKFGKPIYGYSSETLQALAEGCGFRDIQVRPFANPFYPNGLGTEYPENLRLTATK